MEAERRDKKIIEKKRGKEMTECLLKTTHVNEMERWNLCLRPRNMTKDLGGKDRAATVQYGRS